MQFHTDNFMALLSVQTYWVIKLLSAPFACNCLTFVIKVTLYDIEVTFVHRKHFLVSWAIDINYQSLTFFHSYCNKQLTLVLSNPAVLIAVQGPVVPSGISVSQSLKINPMF